MLSSLVSSVFLYTTNKVTDHINRWLPAPPSILNDHELDEESSFSRIPYWYQESHVADWMLSIMTSNKPSTHYIFSVSISDCSPLQFPSESGDVLSHWQHLHDALDVALSSWFDAANITHPQHDNPLSILSRPTLQPLFHYKFLVVFSQRSWTPKITEFAKSKPFQNVLQSHECSGYLEKPPNISLVPEFPSNDL